MKHLFVQRGISLVSRKPFVTNKYSGLFTMQPEKANFAFNYEEQKLGFHIENLLKERITF